MTLCLEGGNWRALQERVRRTGETSNPVVSTALAEALDLRHRTHYEVSTSAALVPGVFAPCVCVREMMGHGGFGLGTFDGLEAGSCSTGGVGRCILRIEWRPHRRMC